MIKYEVIVIGCSMGGFSALETLLKELPAEFPLPIITVQHISSDSDNYLVKYLNEKCDIIVKEVEEKENLQPGTVYFPPPDFHVLIEEDKTFTLSVEDKVNFSRPSIDVLFETAAFCCKEKTIGIILTGGNGDGTEGLKLIKSKGGLTIVQDPNEAEVDIMPKIAISNVNPDYILKLKEISGLLINLVH